MAIIFQEKGGKKKEKIYKWYSFCNSATYYFLRLMGSHLKSGFPPNPGCFLIPHHSFMLPCFLFQHPFREDSKICSEAFQVAVWIPHSKPYFFNNDGKMLRDVLGAVLRCYRGALASVCSAKEVQISKCFLRAIWKRPDVLQLPLRNPMLYRCAAPGHMCMTL